MTFRTASQTGLSLIFGLLLLTLGACDEPPEKQVEAEPAGRPAETAEVPTEAEAPAEAMSEASQGSGSPFETAEQRANLDELLQNLIGQPQRKTSAHSPQDPHAALLPEQLIRVALQHQAEGRPQEAMATLVHALTRFPNDPDLLSVRAAMLLQTGRTAEALSDLEEAAKAKPDDPAILVNRAQAYRQFGNDGKALADLGRALEIDPDFIAARFNRGSLHFNAGRYEEALADFERCVAVDPHMAPPYFNLAMTREALNDRQGAIADLRRFVELSKEAGWRDLAEKQLAEWAGSGGPAVTDGGAAGAQ